MANGLDQYLANRIAASGVFQVVADPKKADAIFTDKLGEAFEARLKELFPTPVEKKESSAADKKESSPAYQSDQQVMNSSFGRAKGTIFLVETSSRSVVWSAYERPRNTTPNELDRTAQRIVESLKSPGKQK